MRVTAGKPVSMSRLTSTKPTGMRVAFNYQSKGPAARKVKELRKKGYRAKWEEIMGNFSVWVSPKYFKDHPRAKGYLD